MSNSLCNLVLRLLRVFARGMRPCFKLCVLGRRQMSFGVGFYFWALRPFRTPRNLGSSHEKPGLLLLMAPIVRGRKARRIDCQASLELVDPRHALEDREELCEII